MLSVTSANSSAPTSTPSPLLQHKQSTSMISATTTNALRHLRPSRNRKTLRRLPRSKNGPRLVRVGVQQQWKNISSYPTNGPGYYLLDAFTGELVHYLHRPSGSATRPAPGDPLEASGYYLQSDAGINSKLQSTNY